jgi:hypothetical protein
MKESARINDLSQKDSTHIHDATIEISFKHKTFSKFIEEFMTVEATFGADFVFHNRRIARLQKLDR